MHDRISSRDYELLLEPISLSSVIVDERFTIKYKVTNRLQIPFPGGEIPLIMNWANLGPSYLVPHTLLLDPLGPGESVMKEVPENSLVDGMIRVLRVDRVCKATDGKSIRVFHSDGRTIEGGEFIHAIRIKSKEEVSQNLANWLAFFALVILIIFQIIDWWFQNYI